jgi:hypothetical protein
VEQPQTATLTKKFLLGFPKGVFIMSNVMNSPGQPVFAEYVLSPASERIKQWDRIMGSGCNGRLCYVSENENQANQFLNSITEKIPTKPPEPPKQRKPTLKVVK